MEPNMTIFTKMAAILRDFPVVSKDQKHGGFGESYNYRGIDDALAALHPLLAKHGVFMALTDLEPEYHDAGTTKAGKTLVRCVLTGKCRFIADDGSFVDVAFVGEGVDGGDKALMKSQANGLKYVVWYSFCVPTLEKKDSEAFEDEDVAKAAPAPMRAKRVTKAPTSSSLDDIQAAATSSALATAWAAIRPELTQLPSDSPERQSLVAAYKKRQAELG
jgi:hypothetical protein